MCFRRVELPSPLAPEDAPCPCHRLTRLSRQNQSIHRPGLALDRLGITQALGGLAIGLIALLTSYDHITFAGRTLQLPQQWGISFIIASVAIVSV